MPAILTKLLREMAASCVLKFANAVIIHQNLRPSKGENNMKRILCVSLLVLIASVAGFADIARPEPSKTPKIKPSKSIETSLTIHMDSNTKVATLRIPKGQLLQLRAELDQLANENDDTAAVTTGGMSRTQTIVSGMFLSLALVFGGMWFVRTGKASTTAGKTLVILAVVAGVGSAATLVYANAGPPPAVRSITSAIFDKKAFVYVSSASGKVNVEVSDGNSIELNVPAPKGWPMEKEKVPGEE
jgi:hypothetical protein